MNQSQITSPSLPAVRGFSQKEWIRLARMLVSQDVLLAPAILPSGKDLQIQGSTPGQGLSASRASALSLVQNWEAMGFVLSREDVMALCTLPPTSHAWMDKALTSELSARLGGGRKMRPMYPNFPS